MLDPYARVMELTAVKLEALRCARSLDAAGLVAAGDKERWIAEAVSAEIRTEEARIAARLERETTG